MINVIKNKYNTLLCCMFLFVFSCQKKQIKNSTNINPVCYYEIENNIEDSILQPLIINLDFDKISKIIIDDVDWEKVDFDKGCLLNITSPYFRNKITFRVGLAAINMSMLFILHKENNELYFQIVQLFSTVYEYKFVFNYDKNVSDWILKSSFSISYGQGTNIICPYTIEYPTATFIDTDELKIGNCYEELR